MLKFTLDKIDDLDDATKALYKQDGDKFVLQVEGAVSAEAHTALQGQLQATKDEAIDNRKQLGLWKKLGESPDAVQTKLSAAAKGQNPDHEQIVSDLKAAHEAEITELKAGTAKLVKKSATAELQSKLVEAGFMPEAVEGIAQLASSQLRVEDDNSVRIITADGKPMIGSGADGGATLADLAKSFTEKHAYALKDGGKGGGGTPSDAKPGTGGAKTMKRADYDKMTPQEQASTMSKGDVTLVD